MKTILLINHYAGTDKMGMAFRPFYLAKEWLKMGYRVVIFAGNYSHLRIINPKLKKDFQCEEIEGIDYCWVKSGYYNGNGIKRAFSMFRFVGKLWINADRINKDWRPDIVIASSTYPLDTYAAQRIARKANAKLIHEVHDMWPLTLYEVGGMSKYNPFVMIMQLAENSAYKYSDKIVSLLPFAKEYMIKHGMKPEKFVTISNGIVKSEWDCADTLPEEHAACFEKLKQNKNFIVGYFGGHSLTNALDVLLDVAKKTECKEIIYVLVGKGIQKENLVRRKEKEKIENVIFLPPVSKKAVPTLINYFDCIYAGAKDSPLYRFGTCLNKLYDSMMAGKPIILAMTTPSSPVKEFNCGISVGSENVDGIVEAITKIKTMTEDERLDLGNNGRKAALENFTYEKLAVKFAELF